MVKYSDAEEAVLQKLLTHFSTTLNEDRCKVADIDSVFLAMLEEDEDYGCVIDYSDGRRQTRAPFTGDIWVWGITGFFLLRYRTNAAEHDAMVRNVIDTLPSLFNDDRRLGGIVALVNVTQIGPPEPERINDVPVYWIPFAIEVIDKS